MGVRYDADKTKVGMYYTTPIYKFRMRCHWCPQYFEMQTDPEHRQYVIVSGLRKQDLKWQANEEEQVVAEGVAYILFAKQCFKLNIVSFPIKIYNSCLDTKTTQRLANDAMFALEHKETDKKHSFKGSNRITQIQDLTAPLVDDYRLNSAARAMFRVCCICNMLNGIFPSVNIST